MLKDVQLPPKRRAARLSLRNKQAKHFPITAESSYFAPEKETFCFFASLFHLSKAKKKKEKRFLPPLKKVGFSDPKNKFSCK